MMAGQEHVGSISSSIEPEDLRPSLHYVLQGMKETQALASTDTHHGRCSGVHGRRRDSRSLPACYVVKVCFCFSIPPAASLETLMATRWVARCASK